MNSDLRQVADMTAVSALEAFTGDAAPEESRLGNCGTADGTPRRSIVFTPASKIRTEAVDWLLDCWVPRGSVTLLGGREGIGKSTIAVDWVAQATQGKLTDAPMTVAYVVTEDSPEHTVVPRLKAAGADLDRVMFLAASVPDPDDPEEVYESVLDLPGDFPILRQFIVEHSVGLVVLDAAKSVMSSKLKGNDDLDIRRFLEPMARVAQDADCTFVCLVHFSAKKGSSDTGNLIMGSSAWQQVARSVVAVAGNPETGTVKVWNSKANLAPRIRTMEAQVGSAVITTDDGRTTEVGRINWIGECDEDGSALLNLEAEHTVAEDRTEAELWLTDYLSGHGSHPKKEVLNEARKVALADRTVERAFKNIGGVSESRGFPRIAHWSLPSAATGGTGPVPQIRGGTGGTGHDLHRYDGGTGSRSSISPRSMTGGTGGATGTGASTLTSVSDCDEPSDETILDSLDTEHGMSPETVAGSVPKLSRDAALARLQALEKSHLVSVDHRGRYTRREAL